jgi:lysozyme
MAFNLGSEGLSKFQKTIEAIENGDFDKAAEEMGDSLWAEQVGDRAAEDMELMRDNLDES